MGKLRWLAILAGIASVAVSLPAFAAWSSSNTGTVSAKAGSWSIRHVVISSIAMGTSSGSFGASCTAPPAAGPYSCTATNFGRGKTFTGKVALGDSTGALLSNVGSVTVTFSHVEDNGGTSASISPTTITIPATGTAQSATFTYTSENSNAWNNDVLTFAVTGSTSATVTINK
jgi:hypothetical protein